MSHGKFCLFGEDKRTLSKIKNALTAGGNIFIGYSKETSNILKILRGCSPDLIIVEVMNKFNELKPVLEVIDDESLAACILIVDSRNDEIIEFLGRSKVITYIIKPLCNESALQIADLSLLNYNRVLNYEQQVKTLNETLDSRKTVEKAKWILVEQEGISESQAYEIIRKKSRENRLPMKKTAEAIIITSGLVRDSYSA